MAELKILYTAMYQQFDYNTGKYITIDVEEKTISTEQYNNMTSKESIKFFKSLGGTEKVTCKNGRVIKQVSISPSRELRTIRTFKFSE